MARMRGYRTWAVLAAPVALSKETLVEILTEILEGVRTGDTLEGSIEFLLPYPPAGDPEDADFMVQASYRHGNRQGQGGLSMVGQMVEIPDERDPVDKPGEVEGGGGS